MQEELDQMSEFLVLKSTEEQKEEGVDEPVDTAFIEDRDGMPILKASFDVHHFKADEVDSRFYTVSQNSSPFLFSWLLGQILTDFNYRAACNADAV